MARHRLTFNTEAQRSRDSERAIKRLSGRAESGGQVAFDRLRPRGAVRLNTGQLNVSGETSAMDSCNALPHHTYREACATNIANAISILCGFPGRSAWAKGCGGVGTPLRRLLHTTACIEHRGAETQRHRGGEGLGVIWLRVRNGQAVCQ